MVAGQSKKQAIAQALGALADNDPARFESILWLVFGDHWTSFRHDLRRRGFIKHNPSDDYDAITDSGRALLGSLRKAVEQDGGLASGQDKEAASSLR